MNTRQRAPKWAVVLAALFAVICGGVLVVCAGVSLLGFFIYDDLRQDFPRDFTRNTDIEWPQSAKVMFTYDDHSLPLGDGESHIVFDIDGSTFDQWLTDSPPWKVDAWQTGPIPDAITANCSLQDDNLGLLRLLDSPDIQYAAEDLGPKAMPWHNGRLLLLDPKNFRVWLFVWDN